MQIMPWGWRTQFLDKVLGDYFDREDVNYLFWDFYTIPEEQFGYTASINLRKFPDGEVYDEDAVNAHS